MGVLVPLLLMLPTSAMMWLSRKDPTEAELSAMVRPTLALMLAAGTSWLRVQSSANPLVVPVTFLLCFCFVVWLTSMTWKLYTNGLDDSPFSIVGFALCLFMMGEIGAAVYLHVYRAAGETSAFDNLMRGHGVNAANKQDDWTLVVVVNVASVAAAAWLLLEVAIVARTRMEREEAGLIKGRLAQIAAERVAKD